MNVKISLIFRQRTDSFSEKDSENSVSLQDFGKTLYRIEGLFLLIGKALVASGND